MQNAVQLVPITGMPKPTTSPKATEMDTPSVSSNILAQFIETIAADPQLPGVGERLKKALIKDHDFSEAALRLALFGDASL